jgi:putative transposase
VLRYVEANPLRAGLVARAEEWRWSSLHERMCGEVLIAAGPLDLPDNWVGIVNAEFQNNELEDLRQSAGSGKPYGSGDWVVDTAISGDIESTLRRRGRPRRDRRPPSASWEKGV